MTISASRFAPALQLPLRELIRPAKLRNATRRRWFETTIERVVKLDTSVPVTYLGTPYGGWAVPVQIVRPDWVVYSLGAGLDVSFDLELIRRTGCEVHSFDPAPGAGAHVRGLGEPRLHFHELAIWNHDGTLDMFVAAAPGHVALSGANLQNTRMAVQRPCRTIPSIMDELGHETIDLLKFDVEGGEYDVFDPVMTRAWGVKVLILCMFHTAAPKRALAIVDQLRALGYAPVARKESSFTFVATEAL